MSDIKVIDKDGDWVINRGEYPLADHQRLTENPNTTLVLIQPGVPTQIKLNTYLKGQPTLEQIDSPLGETKPKAEAKK